MTKYNTGKPRYSRSQYPRFFIFAEGPIDTEPHYSRFFIPYSRTNSAWVTAKLFEKWFMQSFIPEVKKFLAKENLSFKVLLLLDNCTGHPDTLMTINTNVEVIFLPPNTTFLIQLIV